MRPTAHPNLVFSCSDFAFSISLRVSSSFRKTNRNHFSPSFSSVTILLLRMRTYESQQIERRSHCDALQTIWVCQSPVVDALHD